MSPLAKWTQLFLSEVFKNNQIILQLLEFHKNLIITGWNERNINAKEISSWVTIQINCTFIHPKFTKTLSFLATQCDRGDPPQTCWSRICSTRSPCDTLRREKYYSSSHLCSHWITKWFIFLKEVIACISPGTATVQSLSEMSLFLIVMRLTKPDEVSAAQGWSWKSCLQQYRLRRNSWAFLLRVPA